MDINAESHLRSVDPVLGRLIDKFGPVQVKATREPPFHSLVHAIAHQQLTGKAANTILKRFRSLFGNRRFPTPARVLEMAPEKICSAGFSKAKAKYIQGIAECAANRSLLTLADCGKLTDAEIIARLTELPGIGRWTAEMFLMFNLGRPDVLPVHDFGVRRGFQRAYNQRALPKPDRLKRFGKKWSPYRTTAALYLYRAADMLEDDAWWPKPQPAMLCDPPPATHYPLAMGRFVP